MAAPATVTVTGDFNPELKVREVQFFIPTLIRHNAGPSIVPRMTIVAEVSEVDGTFTVPLYGTNDPDWSPANWNYRVRILGDNITEEFFAQVPYDAGTLNFSALLPAQSASLGTLYAAFNHTHDGGGSGGSGPSPATSVQAATSYGVASSVGAATTYARGDHQHGTPSLGTTGTTAAAGNHNHSGTYDPAGTAASAVAAHVAAGDPHVQYQLESTLTEVVQDIVGAMLVAGANATVSYDDNAGTVTISASGGGGGGAVATFARNRISSGSFTTTSDASFTVVPGLTMSIAAVAGDNVTLSVECLLDMTSSATEFFDAVVLVGGSAVRYSSTGTNTPATEGDPSLYPNNNVRFFRTTFQWNLAVAGGDLSGGNVTFAFAHKGAGAAIILANANYPFRWTIRNDHQ